MRQLREFIWGVILLILGGLLVSGYFNTAIKAMITACKGEKKEKKVVVHKSAPTKGRKGTSKETKK
ncbi:MAG: hypothetical protein LBG59_04855 [Candidatus Peribacteria bacterium]|nr:hypothetical protein [Candidatus Peribacteria bacterium]